MSALEHLMAFQRQTEALSSVAERLGWDQETVMPRGAVEQRAEEMAAMESVLHERRTDPRIGEWLDASTPRTEAETRALELIGRDFRRTSRIPARLAEELARTTSLAQGIWAEARAKDAPQVLRDRDICREVRRGPKSSEDVRRACKTRWYGQVRPSAGVHGPCPAGRLE